MHMLVRVYGRGDCGKCVAAKKKLEQMGVMYEGRDIDVYSTAHNGWPGDGSIDLMVHISMFPAENLVADHVPLPIIQIDSEFYTYPQAMRELKRQGYSIRKVAPSTKVTTILEPELLAATA